MFAGQRMPNSYLRLIDFVYHSTLGLRVIKKKKRRMPNTHDRGGHTWVRLGTEFAMKDWTTLSKHH